MRFLHHFRLKYLLLFSCILSLTILTLSLLNRQDGKSTETDKYIPMRNLKCNEAAFLLSIKKEPHPIPFISESAYILSSHEDKIVLITRNFVVQKAATSQDREQPLLQQKFGIVSATWDKYYSEYILSRSCIEKALGSLK